MVFDIIGGDYKGMLAPQYTFFGRLKTLRILPGSKTAYLPEDIIRFKDLSTANAASGGSAADVLASGVAFGLIGAVAAAATRKNNDWTFGLEFKDGKKVVLRTSRPQASFSTKFRKFIEQHHLEQFDF